MQYVLARYAHIASVTDDFPLTQADKNERQFAEGRTTFNVPSTPHDLEAAFRESKHGRSLQDKLQSYKAAQDSDRIDQEAFRAAVAADKKRGVSKKSPYTLGFTGQVMALTRRAFQLRIQDRFQLFTSYSLSWVRNVF